MRINLVVGTDNWRWLTQTVEAVFEDGLFVRLVVHLQLQPYRL